MQLTVAQVCNRRLRPCKRTWADYVSTLLFVAEVAVTEAEIGPAQSNELCCSYKNYDLLGEISTGAYVSAMLYRPMPIILCYYIDLA